MTTIVDQTKPNHFYHDSLGDPHACAEDHNHPTPEAVVPDIADRVVIKTKDRTLIVDGKEFPWVISPEGIAAHARVDNSYAKVTVTFYAETVEMVP